MISSLEQILLIEKEWEERIVRYKDDDFIENLINTIKALHTELKDCVEMIVELGGEPPHDL